MHHGCIPRVFRRFTSMKRRKKLVWCAGPIGDPVERSAIAKVQRAWRSLCRYFLELTLNAEDDALRACPRSHGASAREASTIGNACGFLEDVYLFAKRFSGEL